MTKADQPYIMQHDPDPIETQEWLEALTNVVQYHDVARAQYILRKLYQCLKHQDGNGGFKLTTTDYVNTLSPEQEEPFPQKDVPVFSQLMAILRWNALAMVVRAGRDFPGLGGHLSSYASIAVLYEIGLNYFFRGRTKNFLGDLIYFQGHSSPGIYARAFVEGRLNEEQLLHFRRESEGKGLSSYPHPWLMPDFWQFPTVSMGLGAIQAIYQARFLKYLQHRGLLGQRTEDQKVWIFCGDGEMDEPESTGALSLAGREHLDNLIFVINCNLQRLDGLVRGNGKVVQELESLFHGAGWNVIKVLWDSSWDELLADDHDGLLRDRLMSLCDGDYQRLTVCDGATLRRELFGASEALLKRVAHLTDQQLENMGRGGHDPQKVYAAYAQAVKTTGQPTVVLVKSVKGYGLGAVTEGQNIAHQQKKLSDHDLKEFCQRFSLPIDEKDAVKLHLYTPPADSDVARYIKARREALGGWIPSRVQSQVTFPCPSLKVFRPLLEGSGERSISTTMAWVRLLGILLKDASLGRHIVPIVPDECRTFGMEGLFRQIGIYAPQGQRYQPVDRQQIMYYREAQDGQLLQEGITEAGGMCSWMAAATSYSSCDLPMIPMYIYYSMFGFQRIGDFAWAAGDMRARGFLLGATAGRTTLSGEGLQHQDGHSHVLASTIPNCRSYDPTFSYEVAVIMHHGLKVMYQDQEDCYYYLTLMNENYQHPPMPKGVEEGIIQGMYRLSDRTPNKKNAPRVRLLSCGTILLEALKAADWLLRDYHISVEVWSVTSFNELRRRALVVERDNLLHPERKSPQPTYVAQCLPQGEGAVVAVTDYMRLFAEQIRAFVPDDYYVLGTDGFGRSDTRAALRHFFEVDASFIAYTSIKALVDQGQLKPREALDAMKRYGIHADKVAPFSL